MKHRTGPPRLRACAGIPAGAALACLLGLAGCATEGPVAPLVPLPDDQMPRPEELAYRPWRVVVADVPGPNPAVAQAFSAELRNQLQRLGIEHVSADERTERLMATLLRRQMESGGDVDIKDLGYELTKADGILTVSVPAVTVKRHNQPSSWKDKEGRVHHTYTSEVFVNGSYTLTLTRAGTSRTVQFSRSEIQTSSDQPHPLSVDALALSAARSEARSSRVLAPLYETFPLTGYIIDSGDRPGCVLINRGAQHGVLKGRIWDLILQSRESNVLVGEVVKEKVIGSARTVEVYPDTCLAKCDSAATRERAKLGMRVRARGFAFSLVELLGGL